jgi:hypothetical protein
MAVVKCLFDQCSAVRTIANSSAITTDTINSSNSNNIPEVQLSYGTLLQQCIFSNILQSILTALNYYAFAYIHDNIMSLAPVPMTVHNSSRLSAHVTVSAVSAKVLQYFSVH